LGKNPVVYFNTNGKYIPRRIVTGVVVDVSSTPFGAARAAIGSVARISSVKPVNAIAALNSAVAA